MDCVLVLVKATLARFGQLVAPAAHTAHAAQSLCTIRARRHELSAPAASATTGDQNRARAPCCRVVLAKGSRQLFTQRFWRRGHGSRPGVTPGREKAPSPEHTLGDWGVPL
jgi:hypothetical protein